MADVVVSSEARDLSRGRFTSVGMTPGSEMGELLDKMLSLVMDGELQNEREELLDYARYALEIEQVLRG